MSNIGESLTALVLRLRLSEPLKFFLFGVPVRKPEYKVTQAENEGKKIDYEAIGDAVDSWICEKKHLRSDFSIEDLAFALNLPKKHINCYFQIYIQKDFRSWKTEMRINRAGKLLHDDGQLMISKAAEEVGFDDRSNFNRQFKRIMGCSPKDWREKAGHNLY